MGKGCGSGDESAKSGGVQNLGSDGVHVCGRFAAACGIVCIAFYSVALMTTNWSYSDNYGDLGGVPVGYIEFGLTQFCFKATVNTFEDSEHLLCFKYKDTVDLTTDNGNHTSSESGYERFSGLEERRGVVFFCVSLALVACFVGAVFSEKPIYNALCLAISAVSGCIAMSAWLNFQEEQNVEVGDAGGLIIGAWMISAVGSITACLDRHYTSVENRTNICNDGISFCGRMASAGTIFCWLLFGLSVNSSEWSTTANLGDAGGLCLRSDPSVKCGDASFGLWKYQIQSYSPVVSNGTEFVDVVLKYTESVKTGSVVADGNDRFDKYGVKLKREVAAGGVLVGILVAILADLFNEKLMFAATMMFIAALAGMIGMSAWVNFQDELSKDAGEKLEFADGGWLEVFAWLTALVSAILFCVNGRRLKSSSEA